MRYMRNFILNILLPLCVGAFIYLRYRPASIIFFKWIDMLGVKGILSGLRAGDYSFHPSSWVIYSLPDALWVYSFTNLMLMIWDYRLSVHSVFWITVAPVIGCALELGQALHFIPGTFDITDFIFILVATLISYIHYLNNKKPNHVESYP
ncbi:MAG: hypothetical protein JWO03_1166 [Bacteroidetes bacterium]|nr:hypothetical protein [Bacteroidota bacterium]